jgi:hypothetical protein
MSAISRSVANHVRHSTSYIRLITGGREIEFRHTGDRPG